MVKIDLHIHTTASDGKMTPKEIVDWAIEKQISAIAIADHDEIRGAKEAVEYSKDKKIEVISAIEIGCRNSELNLSDIHIVGLFVNYKYEKLLEFVKIMQSERVLQKKKMIDILRNLGYDITFEELKEEANGGGFGKPHIANILFRKYPDKFKDYKQIFEELLGEEKPADVQRKGIYNIKDTINLIHDAGGIAILAHPGFYRDKIPRVIEEFVNSNGDGIEVNCNYDNLEELYRKDIYDKIKKIAEENNLLISGGTDFHDKKYSCDIGNYGVAKEEFEKLKLSKPRNNLQN